MIVLTRLDTGGQMYIKNIFIIILLSILQSGWSQELTLISPHLIDMGTAFEDTLLESKIIFTNSGDRTLKISRVQTSCGCTATQLEKMTYEPGEKGEISVKFDTKGQHPGQIRKFVTIYLEEGQPQSARITLQLQLKAYLEIEPRFIDFQDVTLASGNSSRSLIITNNFKQPLRIKDFETNIPTLEIKSPGLILAPGESETINLHFKAVKEGRSDGYVDVTVSEPMAQSKRIPVFIRVSP